MAVIEVDRLRKDYAGAVAVDGLSFHVQAGEIFALLGPNGAGKTTTVEILEGHRHRDSGVVRVLGLDPATGGRRYRERIGIVLQEAGFEEDFTVAELVTHQRTLYPRRLPVDQVIELVGLTEKSSARVKTLSGGQRRRLDLALGLVGDPDLLFLDEPTTGFDPSARRHAWELVANLRDLGKTVLLTTHYMDEAEHLADRVGVLVAGRLVATGAPADLGGDRRQRCEVQFRLDHDFSAADIPDLGGVLVPRGVDWQLRTVDVSESLFRLTSWVRSSDVSLVDVQVSRPSLEDVYLDLIGEVAEPLSVTRPSTPLNAVRPILGGQRTHRRVPGDVS